MADIQSEQDIFLDKLIQEQIQVNVFLVSGIRLTGTLRAYDRFVLILDSFTGRQAIYKHAISTVLPPDGRPVSRPAYSENATARGQGYLRRVGSAQ